MPALPHPPLAAFADLLEAIVPILVMVFWVLGQLFGKRPKPKPPGVRPGPPRPAPPAAAGGQPATLEDTLRREVEEFMRRAQGREPAPPPRAPGKRTQGAAPPRRESPPLRPAPVAKQPPRRAPEPLRPATPEPQLSPVSGAGVSQHVAQHLTGARELSAHVKQLGAEVAQADERMAEHLQSKFTHRVGALEHRDAATRQADARTPLAQELFTLLTKPGGVRQIVVASEILRRPEERWERRGGGAS